MANRRFKGRDVQGKGFIGCGGAIRTTVGKGKRRMRQIGEKNLDYSSVMDTLLQLPACTLIATGRTGTDFLQSLLDSHELQDRFQEIFQINANYRDVKQKLKKLRK